MRDWYYFTSIIASVIYFVISEEKTSMWAFVAIMSYLFYIDDKK